MPDGKITGAVEVAQGISSRRQPVRLVRRRPRARATPAFCRVSAMLSPTNDSDIRVEVWPTSGWNGKLQAVGNGGWAGSISYTALAAAVTSGYAAAATDTGHATPGSTFAIGHRETDRLRASLAARIGGFCQSDREYVLRQRPETRAVERLFDRWQPGADDRLQMPADFDAIVAGAPPPTCVRG